MRLEGFEVPIHKALTEKIMIAGAPREIALLNGTITAALLFGLQSLVALPFGVVVHVVSVALAKKDEEFFRTFKRHIFQKRFYES